jgi:hypothetical protein
MKNPASVSIDVDTLSSIYKGQGLNRPGGYTFIELRTGLETIQRFFEKYCIKTTLFMVGNDFQLQSNHSAIQAIINDRHEPANHSMTHPQGFRWLNLEQKHKELKAMGDICESVTGIRPIGFRSPGWNMDDSTIPLLKEMGYRYDSSVFPTSLMPLMKIAHWASMSGQAKPNRTTMGMWRYMAAPITPYQTSQTSLSKRGEGGLIEFPVSVTPILRIPFFATMLLMAGNKFYQALYRSIKRAGLPVHFQMHLSDFVDYSLPELQNQIPSTRHGAYVPQALGTPLKKKLEVFKKIMDLMTADYEFITLKEWAERIKGGR